MSLAYKRILFTIALGISFGTVLLSNPYTYSWSDKKVVLYVYLGLLIVCLCAFGVFAIQAPKTIRVNKLDIAILVFGLITILSAALNHYINWNEQLLTFVLMGVFYFIIRSNGLKLNLPFASFLLLCLLAELVMGWQQIKDLAFPGNQLALSLKGSLDNANLYSCFIVMICCLLYQCIPLVSRNKAFVIFSVTLLLLITGTVIYLTRSRATAIATFVAVALITHQYLQRYPSYKQKATLRRTGKLIMIVGLICSFAFLLTFKTKSALGRILIWKITSLHIFDNFLFGIGYGKFPAAYHFWQSNYFSSTVRPNQFKEVADVNYELFNEPLQVLIETGIVGLISFALLIYQAMQIKPAENLDFKASVTKTTLLCVLVFSLFSYPFHATPILFLFVICLGLLSNMADKKGRQITMPVFNARISGSLCAALCIFIIVIYYPRMKVLSHWIDAKEGALYGNKQALHVVADCYPLLQDNALFLHSYGEISFSHTDYAKCIFLMEKAKHYYLNEQTLYYLGLSYQRLKNYHQAEISLINWSNLLPNRFRPRYQLAMLYQEKGDLNNAKKMAQSILSMPEKVPSGEVDEIKMQMKQLLHDK